MSDDPIGDPYWMRVCPHCRSDALRVVACKVENIDNGNGVDVSPDGFSFRDVGYDTYDLAIRCGSCRKLSSWDDCPCIVPEPSIVPPPSPEDVADASLTAAVLKGAFP
jgi:hypothetical protein